jgi:hypothetical protein
VRCGGSKASLLPFPVVYPKLRGLGGGSKKTRWIPLFPFFFKGLTIKCGHLMVEHDDTHTQHIPLSPGRSG